MSFAPSIRVLNLQRDRLEARQPERSAARLLAVGGANYQRVVPLLPGSPIFFSRVRPDTRPSAYDLSVLADAATEPEFFGHLVSMLVGARDLPGSLQEVRSLALKFGARNAKVLTGANASEKQIDALAQGNQLAAFDYIHFATHGVAQTRRPMMSALLTGIEDRDARHDGYLSAQEISAWNLNARLVVLSACDSAIGRDMGGEGILGLPNAFLVAGAAATMQTLWAIPDQATALWIPPLYDRVLEGESPSVALMHMKRDIASEQGWQPRYVEPTPWAAFGLYGY